MLINGEGAPMNRSGLSLLPVFIGLSSTARFSKVVRHVLALDMSRKWANVFGRMTRNFCLRL
jgi:hypothetical protein